MLLATPYIFPYTSHRYCNKTFSTSTAVIGDRKIDKFERRLHVPLTRTLLNLESPSHQIQMVAVDTYSVGGVVRPFVAVPVAMEFVPKAMSWIAFDPALPETASGPRKDSKRR